MVAFCSFKKKLETFKNYNWNLIKKRLFFHQKRPHLNTKTQNKSAWDFPCQHSTHWINIGFFDSVSTGKDTVMILPIVSQQAWEYWIESATECTINWSICLYYLHPWGSYPSLDNRVFSTKRRCWITAPRLVHDTATASQQRLSGITYK